MTHSQPMAHGHSTASAPAVPAQRQGRDGSSSGTAPLGRSDSPRHLAPSPGGRLPELRREPEPPAGEQRAGRRIVDYLRLIVAVPLVAVVAFAGIAFVATAQQVTRTTELRDLALLSAEAGSLAHALQRERAAAAQVLLSPRGSPAAQLDGFAQQAALADDVIGRYRQERERVADEQTDLLGRIDGSLDGLGPLREQVRKGERASVSAVAFSYRILIADLLAFREAVARSGAPADLADRIRAAAALSRATEAIGQQQVAVLRAVAAGELTPAMRQEITATRTGFTDASVAFGELGDPRWRTQYERASVGDKVLAAQRLQDEVGRAQPGAPLRLDTAGWIDAMLGWSARLFNVQEQVDQAIIGEVDALRDDQLRQAALQAGGVVLALVVAILLTAIVARRITRRLGMLQEAARVVAYQRLPEVVAELRAAAPGTVDPDEVANRSAAEVVVGGADEIADVAEAFRAVHREAVRIAGEQAVMRSNVSEIFVHLSRREQRLVDAVLAQVDRVERDETDPDRLQQLYALDHLATRMARINLSLLVLGGSGAARVRREDVPLVKVLQAAISQIEHYTRVRFGLVDDDVAVVSEAVDEIVHLLAELLDNATGYSPPESEVWVTGRALGDRIIVQIGDEGVGLTSGRRQTLNELLASPPAIDIAAVRAMGLTVVGHIAARYGVRVELRPGQGVGTIAEITLPKDVFRPILAGERAIGFGPLPLDKPVDNPLDNPLDNAQSERDRRAAVTPAGAAPALFTPGANAPITPGANAPTPNVFAVPQTPAQGAPQVPPGPGAWPPLAEPAKPAVQASSVDDPTELLPIFQAVNGWFRTEAPTSTVTIGEGPTNWETKADAGWVAAAQAASPDTSVTTRSGLPVRAPQRQLVPGAAAPPERSATPRRDPSTVAAAMSAYARGVAGRRTQSS